MARTYKRDANGRFAGGGGGGGGKRGGGKKASGGKAFSGRKGKVGKATAGRTAKAKYKAAAGKARAAESTFGGKFKETAGPKGKRYASRQVAGAKAGLTKVTKGLRGGKTGNIGRTKSDERRSATQAYSGALGRQRAQVAASRPAPKASTATASKKGKAAGGAKARKPDFKPKRKGATAASTVSEQAALARLGSGRRLRGKGNNPTARAERVLERGLSGTGRRARKSEATAKRAIDYMASQGTLGKRGKRRKA